jgi:hypothetical protein
MKPHRFASVLALLAPGVLTLCAFAGEPGNEAYDAAMKKGEQAAGRKAWADAAASYAAALRLKPGDPPARESFLKAIQNVEIYYTRFGDLKTKMLEKYGMKGADEEMIQPALKWLARAQQAEGCWRCLPKPGATDDMATTAFVLLAFLADGNSEVVGPYRELVQKAVKWLLSRQRPDGSFGGVRHYTEGLASLAIVEAFAMGGTEEAYLAAQRAVTYLVKVQTPEGGWLYGVPDGEPGDTSVTGMMFQPLMQGQRAWLDFDPGALERSRAYVDRLTFDGGWVRYRASDSRHSIAMVAIGNLVRVYAGAALDEPAVKAGLQLLRENVATARTNMYYLYYGTMLSFLAGGETWAAWSPAMKEHLKATQVREGESAGCWQPKGSGWESGYADYISAVENTAMAVLSLQCCYRYVPKSMLEGQGAK